jgi:hypothetical protein
MNADNIIQKQILHLHIHTPVASPLATQAATAKWCSEVLVNAIGRRLEKYAEMEDVIRIDKIEIELNTGESPDEVLAEKIASELEREIQLRMHSELPTKNTVVVQKGGTVIEALIFFLENGYLPWWSSVKKIEELMPVTQFDSERERSRFKKLFQDKKIVIRFSNALPLNIFVSMLSQLFEVSEKQISSFFQNIEQLGSVIQNKDLQYQFFILVKQEFVEALIRGENETGVVKYVIDLLVEKYQLSLSELRRHIRKDEFLSKDITIRHVLLKKKIDLSGTSKKTEPEQPVQNGENVFVDAISLEQSEKLSEQKPQLERQQLTQKQDGIYIGNAGLVLLAPFISRFFENLGIVENNIFNSKDLALAMLQWLVTGNELHAEFDLVLPKIFCGMEPGEPVIIIPHLPEGFKNEGEILLQSVIEYWSILKNTSVAGLRDSFLQREGKISFQKNEWLLQVEQKSYDMLLQHLPWNISMIRLSWMPYLLRTEWIG